MNLKSAFLCIFLGIYLAFLTILTYRVGVVNSYQTLSTRYKEDVRSAAESALEEARSNAYSQGDDKIANLFATSDDRNDAVDTFFDVYSRAVGKDSNDDADLSEITSSFPMICLVDFDGFYMGYSNLTTDEYSGLYTDFVISEINTWSKKSGNYLIQYYLGSNDKVSVTNIDTLESYTGECTAVYAKFGSPTALNELSTTSLYETARKEIVYDTVTKEMSIVINQYNFKANGVNNVNNNGYYYDFSLPSEEDTTWANLLDMPAVIAFYQGDNVTDYITMENYDVYAMSGYEIEEDLCYYITADNDGYLEYHEPGSSAIVESQIIGREKSKEDAASEGAYPEAALQ